MFGIVIMVIETELSSDAVYNKVSYEKLEISFRSNTLYIGYVT